MNIALYKNLSEKNKIGKTLSGGIFYTGDMRAAASVTSPQITIECADTLSDYNYAYIQDFGRYYFITDIVASRTGLWRFDLAVDVLESYKDAIKNLPLILSDSQVKGANNYLSGSQWVSKVKDKTDILTFPTSISGGSFVLITAGG